MQTFNFKKKFGQNFLNSKTIINKIVQSINPRSNDLIIEIGPGAGALTKCLKQYNSQIIAYEVDTDTKKYLDSLEDDKCKIIYEDFLETNILDEIKRYKYDNLYIIGNLPYYITTKIISHIIDLKLNPKEMVFMVQKEVADRFMAKPGNKEYGYMTVILNYNYNLEKVVDVDKSNFTPIPKVDSSVVKLISKETNNDINYKSFDNFIKEAFRFKRKTIKNNLTNYNEEKLNNILTNYNLNTSSRPEDIPLEAYIDLFLNK